MAWLGGTDGQQNCWILCENTVKAVKSHVGLRISKRATVSNCLAYTSDAKRIDHCTKYFSGQRD